MKRNYFKKNILLIGFLCLSLNLNANHNYFSRISSPTHPTTTFQYKIVSFFVGLFNSNEKGYNPLIINSINNYSNTSNTSVLLLAPPTASCQNIIVYLDATGNVSITEDAVNNGSTGVGILSFDTDITDFNCSNLGPNSVTLTVTDDADPSNPSTCLSTVTVVDTTAPTGSTTAGSTGNNICFANVASSFAFDAAAAVGGYSDPCGTLVAVQTGSEVVTGDSSGWTVTYTFDVIDGNGNSLTNQTYTHTGGDATPPNVICQNISVDLDDASGEYVLAASEINNGSTDNCGTVNLVSVTPNTFDCTNIGPNTVTLTINDGNGNTDTCTATVTVTDASTSASVSILSDPSDPSKICNSAPVTFTATPGGTYGTPAYQWQINGSDVPGQNGSTFTTSSLVNADTVTVVMTSNLFACGVVSNPITVTVNDTVPVTVSIQSTATTICQGEEVTFSENINSNGGLNPSYEWFLDTGSGPISVSTDPTYVTSNLNHGDQVYVVMTPDPNVQCPDIPSAPSNVITINVDQLPTLSTEGGSVCASSQTSIDLNTLVTTNGTTVTFYTSQANADNDTGTISATVSPSSETTYYVRSEFATGCYVTDTILILIDPLPEVNAGSDQAICIGASIDLSTLPDASGTNRTYYINQTDANNATGAISSNVSPGSTTTYFVRSENGATGCYNTDSVVITVNPLPNVNAGPDQTICAGDSVTLSGSGASTYTWDNGVTNGVAFTPSATTVYTVTGTDANGCQNTDTVTVTVNPLPNVNAGLDQTICAGDSVTLSGSGASTYTWDNGVTNGVAFTPSATTVYTVTGTDANGCQKTDTVTVTVNSLPTVDAGPNQTICAGESVTLSGSGASSYTWNNGVINGVPFTPASTTTYTVTGTDVNGCQNTDTVTITVNPLLTPSVSITASSTQICSGANVTFTATPNNGGTSPSYQWYVGATPVGTNSPTYSTTTLINGQSVTVVMTPGSNVCVSAASATSNAIPISVYTAPVVLGAISGTFSVCPVVTGIIYSVPNDPNIVTYNWSLPIGFNITAGAGTNQITVTATSSAANGNIVVTGTNPCGTSASSTEAISVGTFAAANAGPDQTVCGGTTQVTLAGSIGGAINRHADWDWEVLGGAGGTIVSPNKLNSDYILPASFGPSSDYSFGPGVIRIRIFTVDPAGSCGAAEDFMDIRMLPNPTASISGDATICSGNSSNINFTATPNTTVTYNINGGASQTIAINGTGTATLNSGALASSRTYNLVSVGYTASPACTQTVSGSAIITVTPTPTATISYAQPFCKSLGSAQSVTLNGTGAYTGGTYSAPAGLTIDSSTGAITPSSSISGTYTVTYTGQPSGGCSAVIATTSVTITDVPTATISYAGAPFCKSIISGQTVTLNGTGAYTGGTYTALPAGLTINASTGAITPSSSTAGTYTVTYTGPTTGGCSAASATTSVTITAVPTATISYAGTPFCKSLGSGQAVSLNGTGAYSGGTFSAPAGLTINASTGDITPSSSTAGTYTVTYTGPTTGGCSAASATTSVTITAVPTATISYAGTPFCKSLGSGQAVTLNGTGAYTGGTYTALPAGLTINASTGAITPSSSTAGTYTVTYTGPTTGGCSAASAITSVTITAVPTATISYSPTYCKSEINPQAVSLNGTGAYTGGIYTASPAGLTLNSSTGAITPSTSNLGTYTVTYTIPASGGCSTQITTTSVAIKNPVVITTQPQNVGVCVTEPASLSVVAVGDNRTYQWYKGTTPVSGATSNVLNFGMTTLADAGTYYVVVSGDASCGSVTSNMVTLNVNQVISITDQPDSATLCEGSNVTFTVAATGSVATYQWRKNGINIGGANSSSYTINNITLADGANYDVVISSPGGTCSAAYSAVAVLTVTQIPTATISYATPFCNDLTTPQSVNLTGTDAYTGGTYTASPAGLTINSSTGAITPSTSSVNTYTVTYTIPAFGGCGTQTATTTVTITPLPVANISYSDNAYCESDSNTYDVTLTGSNNSGGTYYAAPAGLTINPSTGTITPSTSSIGNYTITYSVPASAGCGIVTATFNIEIESEPDTTFSYTSSVYCSSASDPTPTVTQSGGTFSSNPVGLIINPSTGQIDLDASIAGSYTVNYTFAAVSGGCAQVQNSQNIDIVPDLSNSLLDGFAYTQLTPPVEGPVSSQILACHLGDGILTLHIDPALIPYIVRWEYNNGSGFVTLPDDGDPDGNVLTRHFTSLIGVTSYRVVFNTGTTCGNAGYSSVAYVSVIPPDLKPEPVQALPTEFCFGGSSTMTASSNYGAEQLNSEGGFDQGQLNTNDPDGWLVDGELGKLSASANSGNPNNWSVTNDNKTFSGILFDNDDPGPPATNEGKFGIANGYYNVTGVGGHPVIYDPITGYRITTLETPIFSLLTLQDATLDFREAYSLTGPQAACYTDETQTTTEPAPAAEAIIEISLDGGVTYTEFLRPTITGPANSGPGSYTDFNDVSIDLSDYFGETDVRVRFTFVRNCTSTWAIDGITLPGANGASTIEWTDQFGVYISNSNTIVHTPITPGYQIYRVTTYINGCRSLAPEGSEDVPLTVDMAYAGVDQSATGGCGQPVQLHAYDNTKGARLNWQELTASGNWTNNYVVPTDPAHDYAPTMATGEWSITSGPPVVGIPDWTAEDPSDYFFPSIYDPRAEFGGPSGQYTLTWTVHGAGGDCSDSVVINVSSCATLDFDGIDDNVTFRNDFDLDSGPFSIEIWVKPDPETELGGPNNTYQTILSKRDESTYTDGYDLMLINNKIYFNWNNGLSFTHSNTISTNRWYHVAVTFDGTNTYKMYIDGILLGSANGPAPIANNFECIMGAMDRAASVNPTPVYYYSGWLDELRIWNVELSINQIRHMMNQEIVDNGGNVRGAVIPIDIPGPPAPLTWANLRGYYRMNQTTDIANGYLLANAGTRDGQMRNITTWQLENSPLPYETDNNGNWYNTASDATSPWVWGHTVWDYPNSTGIDGTRIDWNIVRTSHDVESDLTSANPRDITLLGLIVNPISDLTITAQGTQDETNTGHGLWVTHYLKLDGFMNLIGESQLVQKRYTTSQVNESILDANSGGYIKRDQQGQSSIYNYNYWSSPTGPVNATSNNNNYYLKWQHRDGTDSSIRNKIINWLASGRDGSPTDPISISEYWLWTYNNLASNTYANWVKIYPTSPMKPGLGYTMKGSGTAAPYQNYVFFGKPNNATISNLVSSGNDILVGNPYPCAIDANAFIIENGPGFANSINGALYFWDHYYTNNTHILVNYEGGYAVRNILGGLAAVSPPPTSDGYEIYGGSGTKIPERYVPVGQGFFVTASGDGGQVTFNNSQRIFKREVVTVDANDGSVFFRVNNGSSSKENSKNTSTDLIKRLRLEFKTPEGAIRSLLLGFVPNNLATEGIDYGYDALNYDSFPTDLSWLIKDQRFVIQGVGDFDKAKQYPLDLLLSTNGEIEISLKDLENFDTTVNVFVYDALQGTYTKINNNSFKMSLDANLYSNRFFIAFKQNGNTLSVEDKVSENIVVNFLSSTNEIYVKTINGIDIRQIYLINMIGQTIKSWNATNLPISNNEIRIPVTKISEGNYILKVETNGSTVNKKIIITN